MRDETTGSVMQKRIDEWTLSITLWDATRDGRIEWRPDLAAKSPNGEWCEEYVAELDGTVYHVSEWGVWSSGAIVSFWSGIGVSDLFRLCSANHDRRERERIIRDREKP